MTTERDKLLDKIRALLSKTIENGCTHEEAMAALAKAQSMMDAYEVSDEELRLTKAEKAAIFREPRGTKDRHEIKSRLAVGVAAFCDCRVWRDSDGTLVFCGLRPDAQFATWLLDHLAAFVQSELADYLMTDLSPGQGSRRKVITGFVLGCAGKVTARLRELKEQSQPRTNNNRALVVVKDQAVRERMAELRVNLTRARNSSRACDSGAFAAGRMAGDRATFGRPVSQGGALCIGRE
jgi:hypothetical protein